MILGIRPTKINNSGDKPPVKSLEVLVENLLNVKLLL